MSASRVSATERRFIEEGIEQNLRNDGRSALDYRPFYVELSVMEQTNGSARLKQEFTDILVGVKVDIGEVDPQRPNLGRIEFSVDCASPEYEGQGADSLNVELAKFLTKLFASPCGASLDLSKLCLAPGLQCWVLYVDVLVLSSSGNLFDAASIACRAALADTRIPKVNVVMAEAGLVEIEIVDDPDEYTLLDVSRVPICITHTLISPNGVPVLDTTIEEENCMRARLSVGVNKAGSVFAIQLGGQGSLSKDLFNMIIQSARRVGIQLCLELDKLYSQDIARKPADIGQIF